MFKKEHCANWMEPKKRAHMHDFKQIDLYSSKLHRSTEHHKAGYKANFNSKVAEGMTFYPLRFCYTPLASVTIALSTSYNARWF